METPVSAKFHRITFDLDRDAGWYIRRPELVPFAKVPEKLKVERTQEERFRNQGAHTTITGPMRAKRRTFFSGMRALPVEQWYIGNDYEQRGGKKVLSLVLFHFSGDFAELNLYYFNGFYRAAVEDRTRWAVAFIRHMERQGGA